MSETSLPRHTWRYTDPRAATAKLERISRSEKDLNAFMAYVAKCERLARFGDAVASARKRAARYGVPVEMFTCEALEEIYQRQDGRCFYCTVILEDDFETDHKKAISKGGAHALANLVLSCTRCNRTKYTKSPREFRLWMAARNQPTLFEGSA